MLYSKPSVSHSNALESYRQGSLGDHGSMTAMVRERRGGSSLGSGVAMGEDDPWTSCMRESPSYRLRASDLYRPHSAPPELSG